MDNPNLALRVSLAVLAGICFAATTFGQDFLFSDDFEDKTAGATVAGTETREGYPYLIKADASKASLKYENNANHSGSSRINIYIVRDHSASISIGKDLDQVEALELKLGYLHFAARGSIVINAAAASETRNGGYRFTFSEFGGGKGERIRITYIDPTGASTVLGYLSGHTLKDIRVVVSGNTQQLYVGDTSYGNAVPTQRTFNDSAPDRTYLIPFADAGQHLGLRIDDLSATKLPAKP